MWTHLSPVIEVRTHVSEPMTMASPLNPNMPGSSNVTCADVGRDVHVALDRDAIQGNVHARARIGRLRR